MNRLRSEKCRIDIDDFGSGYSSLNMIKDIPFDILKIDRMFFSDSNSGTGKIILEKIVEMAQAMGVDCICEGVETKEQEELLRKIGCKYAQGYLYSKPIPMDEFIEKFMKKDPSAKASG
jgi:EAL domain-containing protein (putative c-di-GMP-specific phosphodiesterase class I)